MERIIRVFGSDEIGQLATSFNDLTSKLQDAITTRDREQKKLSSVLGNMTDGVIATDENGLVILMNKRAEELLGKATYEVIRKPITEVLKLSEVYHLEVIEVSKKEEEIDYDVEIKEDTSLYKDEKKVERAGKKGLQYVEYETTYVNGEKVKWTSKKEMSH